MSPFETLAFQTSVDADGVTTMVECNVLRMLGQVSEETAGTVFRAFLRGAVRGMICEVMALEVTELCGDKHRPQEGEHYRAGSSSGRALYEGEREEVVRPRVRRRESDGSSSEVLLSTYAAARCPRQLQKSIVQAMKSGVSTREVSQVHGESTPEQIECFSAQASRWGAVRQLPPQPGSFGDKLGDSTFGRDSFERRSIGNCGRRN